MTIHQLAAVVAATGHERYRWLTSDDNPDAAQRAGYRRLVADRADAIANGTPPAYPSLATQAMNFAGAVAAHVASGLAKVDDEGQARRLAICRACHSYDAAEDRCRECGCYMDAKSRWESSACPLGKW